MSLKGPLKAINTCEFPDDKGIRRVVKAGTMFPPELKVPEDIKAELIRVKAAKVMPVEAPAPVASKEKVVA